MQDVRPQPLSYRRGFAGMTGVRKSAKRVASLIAMDGTELRGLWRKYFGGEPPGRFSHDLLRRALAYKVQAAEQGGLPTAAKRELARFHTALNDNLPLVDGNSRSALASSLKPGSRLIREWKGTTHEVQVLDQGFLWQGRRCRSLTEIAMQITGTRYSGPRFFGLKDGTPAQRGARHGR